MMNAHIDFGYPWWLSYGHVVVFVPALALLLLALARKWGRGAIVLFAVLVLWSGVSLFMSKFLFIYHAPTTPAENTPTDPAEMEAVMGQWTEWAGRVGEGMVDLGTLGGAYSQPNAGGANGRIVGLSSLAGETANRALECIDSALTVYPDDEQLNVSARAVREFIVSSRVAHWVELAERAAFKGYYQRAIDCYRDALYYLTRDRPDLAGEAAADRITREIDLLRVRLDSGDVIRPHPDNQNKKGRRSR